MPRLTDREALEAAIATAVVHFGADAGKEGFEGVQGRFGLALWPAFARALAEEQDRETAADDLLQGVAAAIAGCAINAVRAAPDREAASIHFGLYFARHLHDMLHHPERLASYELLALPRIEGGRA